MVTKAADPAFVPEPLDYTRPDVRGTSYGRRSAAPTAASPGPTPPQHILRRIRAADGTPGVHSRLCGVAGRGLRRPPRPGRPPACTHDPGTVLARRHGAVLVRTGDGAIWVGHLRSRADTHTPGTQAARNDRARRPPRRRPRDVDDPAGYREISYHRDGPLGVLSFRFYNGAMSTAQCRRLLAALRHATAQDTRVLLLRGGQPFSNGIHLGVIDAAPDPAAEAWDNINAIDDVCQEIITCDRPTGRVLGGGQRGRRWSHAGARRRPGHCSAPPPCSTRTTGPWACTAPSTGPTSFPAASEPAPPPR